MIGRCKRLWSWLALGWGHRGLVLDVGSGNSPHPRADVLCDRYVGGTGHRHEATLVRDRPLVCANLSALPFPTGAFDFVICRHVLEHLEPQQIPLAVGELTRVAKAGYVETPSPICEMLMPDPYHRSFVELREGLLVFTPKEELFPFRPIARFLLEWAKSNRSWQQLIRNHPELWTTSLQWKKVIRYRIDPPRAYPVSCEATGPELSSLCNSPAAEAHGLARLRAWTKTLLHGLLSGGSLRVER